MIGDIFVVAAIADIHFGAIRPSSTLYEELKIDFLDEIKDKNIDMVVICGDYYNSIISLNSSTAKLSFRFMDELIDLCEKEGIKYLRIIQGTLSHDNNQLDNLDIFREGSGVDVKIVKRATEEHLEEGLNILYIPEEYMSNPDEYYKEFYEKEKYYDFIFGHGMFTESSFGMNSGETNISKAPVFDSKEFINMSRGPIIFGHIHTRSTIRKHIYYIGSFSRWVYGQEEPKGFMYFAYDTKTHRYCYEFIENVLAKYYDTIEILDLSQYDTIEEWSKYIRELKRDYLRIRIIINDSNDKIIHMITSFREYYSNKSEYKLEVINKGDLARQKMIETKVNNLLSDYGFVFDKKLPKEYLIHKFIQKKYGKDFDVKFIENILYNK